jgi:hypothetical protein
VKQNILEIVLVFALNVLHLPLDIAGWSSGSPEKRQISGLTGFSRMLENQSKLSLLIFGTRWAHNLRRMKIF